MTDRDKKDMLTWVIEATEIKFEVRGNLLGHMETVMASDATIMAVPGNMHVDARVMEVIVIEYHMPISHSPCRRRSKGPSPSCWSDYCLTLL